MNPFMMALGMSNPLTMPFTMGNAVGDTLTNSKGGTLVGGALLLGAGAAAYHYRHPIMGFLKDVGGFAGKAVGSEASSVIKQSAKATARRRSFPLREFRRLEDLAAPTTMDTAKMMGPRYIGPGYWRTSNLLGLDAKRNAIPTAIPHYDRELQLLHERSRRALAMSNSAIGKANTQMYGTRSPGGLKLAAANGRSSVLKSSVSGIVTNLNSVRTMNNAARLSGGARGRYVARNLFRAGVSAIGRNGGVY